MRTEAKRVERRKRMRALSLFKLVVVARVTPWRFIRVVSCPVVARGERCSARGSLYQPEAKVCIGSVDVSLVASLL